MIMSKRKINPIEIKDDVLAKEFLFGPEVECEIDPHSKSRYINLPIELPDKSRGVVVILRAKNAHWDISKHIRSIIVNYV